MIDIPSYMYEYGENLVENGYNILPITPKSKVPGILLGGRWTALDGWQQYCSRPVKTLEIEFWKRWPQCGIGLACGSVIGVDIDIVTDPALALELDKLARVMMGDTPATRIGQAPKRALFYRAETPFSGRKLHPLEIYGVGSQMVIYGIHPVTERPYSWVDGSGLNEIDISQLPVITEAQAMSWLEEAYKRVPVSLRPARLAKTTAKSEWSGPSDPRGTYEAVKSALAFIPNDDVDGSSWIAMLNAIKGALGEQGRDLWLDWSTSSAKSGASGKSDTAERRWKSAKPTRIGAGTIYYQAEQRGWIPEADLILNGSVVADPDAPHPAAALLARYAGDTRPVEPLKAVPVPTELWDIGGVLGRLVRLAIDTARSPQPFLALGAALTCVGVVAGQKYRSTTNLRTNLYTVGLADSGGGKDNARVVNEAALFAASLGHMLGGEEIASGAALFTSLKKHPCRLFQIDEMAEFLRGAIGQKASTHKAEIWSNLTKLFTSANRVMIGAEYANQVERPRIDIVQPCCGFYGVTVPREFWAALEHNALGNGSIARFLIFLTDNNYPERNKRPAPMVFSPELIEGLQAISCGMDEPQTGNLAGVMARMPTPYTVPTMADAEVELDRIDDFQTNWLRQTMGTPDSAIIARYWENIAKVALIRAISDNPIDPRMTRDGVLWAEQLVEHCTRTLMREANRFVAVNETEANVKRVLETIRKHGSIYLNSLTKKTQFINKRTRDDVLLTLVEGGQITVEAGKADGAGRPSKRYSIVRED